MRKRRQFTDAQKKKIVREYEKALSTPGQRAGDVLKKHKVDPASIHHWRKDHQPLPASKWGFVLEQVLRQERAEKPVQAILTKHSLEPRHLSYLWDRVAAGDVEIDPAKTPHLATRAKKLRMETVRPGRTPVKRSPKPKKAPKKRSEAVDLITQFKKVIDQNDKQQLAILQAIEILGTVINK